MKKDYVFCGHDVGPRLYNCLRNEGIDTIQQLSKIPPDKLLVIPNFGHQSLSQVMKILYAEGLIGGTYFPRDVFLYEDGTWSEHLKENMPAKKYQKVHF